MGAYFYALIQRTDGCTDVPWCRLTTAFAVHINSTQIAIGTNTFMRGSRNFRQGGGGGGVHVSLTKEALTTFFFCYYFFSPQLILQKSNGQFQRNLPFFKVPEGGQHFPGGGGGGPIAFSL